MTTPADIEKKLWKALHSDRTVMLGLNGTEDGHSRPMTAQYEHERGPLWFFTSTDNSLIPLLAERDRAIAAFASKGHDIFASISGRLSVDKDRGVIDRLWNPYVAAWFQSGKDDPKLTLLRLDAEHAKVWVDASSLIAGVKILLGADPKKDYRDKVAEVPMR